MAGSFGVNFDDLESAFDDDNNDKIPSKKIRMSSSNIGTESETTPADTAHAESLLSAFLPTKSSNDTSIENNGLSDSIASNNLSAEDMGGPQITVHQVETMEACTHEVAIPPGQQFCPLPKVMSNKPARVYPFVLDPFQKEAIICLENNESVLVSAHTSAGKTVVAEYAIAMSLRDKQRVIYTTPIKALSNQKYREFFEAFQDVGLMTGDVTINPNASCLIMTTEILRSMLYRGSEVMREVGWVIFDEIHYMRDKERGVVWEESIILLPDQIHHVFLSATIPNALQFAEWIAAMHHQPCHVVYTDYRPTPLQHYVYPCGGDGLHLVVSETGEFREDNFAQAMSALENAAGNAAADSQQRGRRGGSKQAETHCFKIVKLIMERKLEPVIVFSFAKKECEIYALKMAALDFNTAEEKLLVQEVFQNAIDGLSEEDRKLPQVESVLPLLQKGIGIHHSGLLPLLKETTEILFGEGLIKCLFATETFSMGLNMPARTVLFTSARKFDGTNYRWISSGEYIQMSGRAGRRGLDDKGTVILMVDESMPALVGSNILKGLPDPLNSAFHLTYNMVLNLLRVEEINPEFMLEKSFFQFQNYAAVPEIVARLNKLRHEYEELPVEDEESIASYYQIKQHLETLTVEKWNVIRQPRYIVSFMQTGRLIHIVKDKDDFGWGVVVNITKKQHKDKVLNSDSFYVVQVLLRLKPQQDGGGASTGKLLASQIRPSSQEDEEFDVEVVPVTLDTVCGISAARLILPKDLRPRENRLGVFKSVAQVMLRFEGGPPPLKPVEDMGIQDPKFLDLQRKAAAFEERLSEHWLHGTPELARLLVQFQKRVDKAAEINAVKEELLKKRSLLQMDELKNRKRVLRRLGYCTASDVIELKGRVACEVDSGDELVLAELLFNGVFNDLNVQQVAALLSCFVFEERASEMPTLTEELVGPLRIMQDTARRIAKVSRECKLELDEEEYVDHFKPHLMDIVAAWAGGTSFAKICSMTDVFEGSIIRCMRRLEELLRQMCNAAKAIGNADLEAKFAEAIVAIKRDIIFAASLYL